MKLTFALILFFNLQSVASVYSQTKVTLNLKSTSFKKVLSTIERQSSYHFVYSERKIPTDKIINLNVNDEEVTTVLNKILVNSGFTFNELENHLVVITPVGESLIPIKVSGKVLDEEGTPLIGASVKIKGTTTGAITDVNGAFSLDVPDDGTLVVSYIGYQTQEVAVGGKNLINITLKNSGKLNEVVVTALGIKRQEKQLGYSITQVSGEEVSTTREPTFINSLEGKVAGLVIQSPPNGPGGSSRVILRGTSNISGSQPLYVIDGVLINSDTRENTNDGGKYYGGSDPGDGLSSINPDDIETISILKGASAAALYGGQAQAGVILITTKKGKKNQGFGITFNSNTVLERMVPYDDLQYTYGRGYLGRPYTPADYSDPIFYGQLADNSGDAPGWSWGGKLDGRPFLDIDGKTKPYVAQKASTNFDRFFRTGVTTTNSVALTKGLDNGSYRVSISDTKDNLPTPGESYDRYNGVFRLVQDYGTKLHTDFKVDLSRTSRYNAPLLRSDGRGSFSLAYPRIANTTDIRLLDDKNAAGGFVSTYNANPYLQIEDVTNNQIQNRALTSANITYDITKHFHANVVAGYDYINTNALFVVKPNNIANTDGVYRTTTIEQQRSDVRGLLSYENKYKNFTFSSFVGGELEQSQQYSIDLYSQGLADPNLLNFNNASNVHLPTELHGPRSKVNSVFGEVQFGYNDYLFLEATGRNDWYSALASTRPNFKLNLFYPSVNLSYVFTQALNIESSVLSFGKLRASYGQTGSNPIPGFTDLTFTLKAPVNGITNAQITGSTVPPPSLKPETTTETEVGTELRFFNDRIAFDFAYYYKKSDNFLLPSTVSVTTTFNSVYVNGGSMYNKGIEMLLTGSPVKTKNFSWNVSVNAAKNKNMVTALIPELAANGLNLYYNIAARVGYPFGSIFGSTFLKNAQGQNVYIPVNSRYGTSDPTQPNDAVIKAVDNNQSYLGNPNPNWSGGITNTFNYKNFSFSFLIDAQFGGQIYEAGARWTNYFGNSQASLLGRDGTYIPTGVINTGTASAPVYVKNTLPYSAYIQYNDGGNADKSADEAHVFSRTFEKLRQVSFGYTLPKDVLTGTFVRSVTFSLIARNLFYIHKALPTFDPEASDSIGSGYGWDTGALPSSRTYGFNLNITF
ncbi:SusC/RagA family TonB-linked outer membrane protein [Mucilaginibacter sp. BJC16-A38]|uniref:SusC/RagA family TonB-linked outer membrane protein n=1 Tax=Mucilaginibacter phenanthrenivorans TaxID=1234842 RepID=UPI00215742D1|nr:SusC/RagA family TonB-linked outer membrane protein [Mucilaginibacter phenanthrenivorans]MCR8560104.1 SusC/RagA family TonB-linked outer membrane protein [Mucilaginibacter phenanthrenivorans]